MQRPVQHQRVLHRHIGVGETHAPGFRQLGHLGQRFATQPARERTQRVQMRQVQAAGAELEHLDEAGFIEHRVGVGRAHQRSHAAGHCSGHFRFEHALVFMAGFAQARGQVHEARRHHTTRRVQCPAGGKVGADPAQRDDPARGDGHVARFIKAGRRVDQSGRS